MMHRSDGTHRRNEKNMSKESKLSKDVVAWLDVGLHLVSTHHDQITLFNWLDVDNRPWLPTMHVIVQRTAALASSADVHACHQG